MDRRPGLARHSEIGFDSHVHLHGLNIAFLCSHYFFVTGDIWVCLGKKGLFNQFNFYD